MSIVELKKVSRIYESGDHIQKALDEVDLSLEEGKVVVILGPSGAGKSTLLNLLGGLDSPTEGSIVVDGKDISDLSNNELAEYRAETVGFVFQAYNLIPTLTVKENVALVKDIVKNAFNIEEMIDKVGLIDHLNNFPTELSGGEQQRVSIARALAKNPKILLCDEPTGALDSNTGVMVLKLMLDMAREYGKTIIIVTHNQNIAKMADVVVHVKNGKIVSFEEQADALRPYVPKGKARLAIDRLKAMNRLSFGTKWNLRDILRHKSRSFMTLVGVLGCTLLISAALGTNDTMTSFLDLYYDEVLEYSSKVNVSEDATNKDAIKLAEKLEADRSASVSVQIEEDPVSFDIYEIENNMVSFLDENNNKIELPKDGALVCIRIRDEYGIEIGDRISFSPYGTSDKYEVEVKGFNRSMSKSISVSEEYAQNLFSEGEAITDKDYYKISTLYTKLKRDEIADENVSSIQTREDMMGAMDSFMQIMYTMIIVLVVAAIVLGIIVLYNLGIMSFTERYREMATLKVVGFKDRQIGKLLISQNVWLSVIGIILGVPAGYAILVYLMKMMASEYEMKTMMSVQAIVISAAITFIVSLVVGLMIAKKNKKIEMVAALKMRE